MNRLVFYWFCWHSQIYTYYSLLLFLVISWSDNVRAGHVKRRDPDASMLYKTAFKHDEFDDNGKRVTDVIVLVTIATNDVDLSSSITTL